MITLETDDESYSEDERKNVSEVDYQSQNIVSPLSKQSCGAQS